MTTGAGRFFDAMAASYDDLEPWYEHLYAVLHGLVRAELSPPAGARRPRALDAGCGTGFQTALLVEMGYASTGLDLSAGLLAVARRRHPAARFVRGDVQALPWPAAAFDVVTSCGSVLSFVPDPGRALREMARVLRPDGHLLIEVERRWSLDLAWRFASAAVGDPLGYGVDVRDARRGFARPFREGIWIDYPGYPRLRLFTRSELDRLLGEAGLTPLRAWGLHSVTNLFPSTMLHRPRLGRAARALYAGLCALDRAVQARGPGRSLANSLVVLAVKRPDRARCSPSIDATPRRNE